jgi:magnesium-transporting ATPase (P-type)
MVERTILAALVMGGVGIAAFHWMLRSEWSQPAARNGLLLLMVLFENVHIGNCRSETRSALQLSPFRSPLLLLGTLAALLVHVVAMHVPLMNRVLGTQPVGIATWVSLLGLALVLFAVMECHKWWRAGRGRLA